MFRSPQTTYVGKNVVNKLIKYLDLAHNNVKDKLKAKTSNKKHHKELINKLKYINSARSGLDKKDDHIEKGTLGVLKTAMKYGEFRENVILKKDTNFLLSLNETLNPRKSKHSTFKKALRKLSTGRTSKYTLSNRHSRSRRSRRSNPILLNPLADIEEEGGGLYPFFKDHGNGLSSLLNIVNSKTRLSSKRYRPRRRRKNRTNKRKRRRRQKRRR
tara:strand:- start:685 stop:1329 length:645 start_codon:yes stop_codon:yes gene_type:complete